MATRERKATRSNTDSPTISNSSSRSDTASPVTVAGQRNTNKSKSEVTTPVRNPLRSTRAGSVAQGGSPPDQAPLPPPATDQSQSQSSSSQGDPPNPDMDSSSNHGTEDTSKTNIRSRPTRQTTTTTTTADAPATRGIRKPVVANAHNIKRNSLPVTGARAAKMGTRRNSSGRMEAILKACAEDESGNVVVSKPRRGRPGNASVTANERRSLLRRKRAASADDKEEDQAEDSVSIPVDDQEESAEKVDNAEEDSGGRKSVDSVQSKCSDATEEQSSLLLEVKEETQEAMEEQEEEVEVEKGNTSVNKTRGRPGRKRKRAGGNQRKSPVKRATTGTPVEVVAGEDQEEKEEGVEELNVTPTAIKSEVLLDEEDAEEVEGLQVTDDEDTVEKEQEVKTGEKEVVIQEEETQKEIKDNVEKSESDKSEKVESIKSPESEEALDEIKNGDDNEKTTVDDDEKSEKKETGPANGELLSIKVEPVDEVEESQSSPGHEKDTAKDSSPSPTLAKDSSLSPVSVQQICGQPAFLENNPGIEKDPKVAAEMVVQKEKLASGVSSDQKEDEDESDKMDVTPPTEDCSAEGKENQNQVNVPSEETKGEEEEGKMSPPEDPLTIPVVVKEIKKEPESPECSTKKENHLKVLGLLTLKAADKAKHEKARRREILKAFPTPPSINLQLASAGGDSDGGNSGEGVKTGKSAKGSNNPEYTGTLKTVIKLNRKNGNGASSAKGGAGGNNSAGGGGGRQSLKMTFQKGRGKGGNANNGGPGASAGGVGGAGKDSRTSASEGEEYYTISKEVSRRIRERIQFSLYTCF